METSKLATAHSEQIFTESFDKFFPGLHRYAFRLVKDREKANDIVQSIFAKWWERQVAMEDIDAAKAYLYTAVYRFCLNDIRHGKVKKTHGEHLAQVQNNLVSETGMVEELEALVQSSIENLPKQCRAIFKKSRFEEKRYADIAGEMNVSIKTVEAQMGKALRILREKLKDYL